MQQRSWKVMQQSSRFCERHRERNRKLPVEKKEALLWQSSTVWFEW